MYGFEDETEEAMQVTITTDELCAMARSEEKLSVQTRWIAAAVLTALAACFLYNVFSITQPWIRSGQAWMLGFVCYLLGETLARKSKQIKTSESCAHFLEREFEDKRRDFLAFRRRLFLFLPGIVITYLGGGPTARAQAMGIHPSSWLFQLVTGPWLLFAIGAILILVWFAFGKAAAKALRDQQDIRRNIEV